MMRRTAVEVIPPRLKGLWSDWQLRVVVLSSLIFQVVLIVFGNRRKYIAGTWIRFVVWSAYLVADYVATVSLGVISSNLGEIYDDKGSVNPDVAITAFWTPFLLLHLGGPDTITAYSLEDNELWLRHFLGLAVQAIGTVYIILMAWTGSDLSTLTILMTFPGLIKYGERTWVLHSASSDQLRDSMRITRSDPGSGNANLIEEYNLRDAEGYNVIPNRMMEVQLPLDSIVFEDNSISKDHELVVANGLFHIFKGLFVDIILGSRDRDTSQTIFRNVSPENAFKLVEMECGFMYDLLYTKATLACNPWGLGLRVLSFTITVIVLVMFSLASQKQDYKKIDLSITFLLLVVAILLEIYAALVLISSDWAAVWFGMHNMTSTLQTVNSLPLFRTPCWSNSMAQYSLLRFVLDEKLAVGFNFLNRFSVIEQLNQQRYITYVEVTSSLREWIYNHLNEKLDAKLKESELEAYNPVDLSTARGEIALRKYGHGELNWTTEVEFDQSILLWNIATEICTSLEDSADDDIQSKLEISRHLSQYMLYLLVANSSMLPTGIGEFVFEDTCADVTKFTSTEGKIDVQRKLLQQFTTGLQLPGERYRSKKSVLSDACRLAADLNNVLNKEEKWSMIADVWAEMLAYVANQSNGRQHAEQLTGGGEFLTHMWLLMAHLGLTQHFQIPQRHAVTRLILR